MIAAALSTVGAWWTPGTILGAVLGWIATFFVARMILDGARYRSFYLYGVIINALGFYWLNYTIAEFGGFNWIATGAIFVLFCTLSAVQFLIFNLIARCLPKKLATFGVLSPIAWVSAEVISVRIFPWYMGHTQLGFVPLAQAASLAGVPLITFLMFWCAESVLLLYRQRQLLRGPIASFGALVLILAFGAFKILTDTSNLVSRAFEVRVIQANISIEEKENIKFFGKNTERYLRLTQKAVKDRENVLAIWPETTILDWIAADTRHVQEDRRLPYFGPNVNLLTGALTFDSQTVYHNSALAITGNGTVLKPYHKQILMPFGEYTPLGDWLPWLKDINSTAGSFVAGEDVEIFAIPDLARVSPLICYEDVVPKMARRATQKGAEVLVNLTNDAWFGDTVAPYQHHLIAAFRAIENHRYLIRSTNSGLTAIVDPLGRTIGELPPFSEDVLSEYVSPLSTRTIFTNYIGELPWHLLALFSACIILANCYKRFKRKGDQ